MEHGEEVSRDDASILTLIRASSKGLSLLIAVAEACDLT
jgi:hypothetical protein